MEYLKVSDNGRYLVTESGTPFFWLGDTAWELFHRLTREEASDYLDNRAAKRFNVIQAVVLSERDGLHVPNVYGDLPLENDDPTRPNEAYFAYVDEIIRLAESKNLYIGLLPTWGDKIDLVGGDGPVIFNADNAYNYGEWIGARYRQQPNIIWILGGDRFPDGFEAIWRAMAEGILAGTEGHALITYHPRGRGQSSTRLHDEQWMDFNLIQSGHGHYDDPNWELVSEDYQRTPIKPTLDSEPNYENHPVAFDSQVRQGRFSAHDVRKAAYRAVLAGACGHTYGHHNVWQMYDARYKGVLVPEATWRDALDAPGAFQMTYLRQLIESRPFLSRIPDATLIASHEADPAKHMVASRDSEGTYALIYVPTAGQTIIVTLGNLSGAKLRAWWFDPQTGTAREAETFERTASKSFTSPESGMDWVLVIDDVARGFEVQDSKSKH